jgi:hypothetical protein
MSKKIGKLRKLLTKKWVRILLSIISVLLTLFLIYMIYRESGIFTTISIVILVLYNIIKSKEDNAIRMSISYMAENMILMKDMAKLIVDKANQINKK